MTTTKELNAIVEELELIDIGDAASYLGEEALLISIEEISYMSSVTTFSLDDSDRTGNPIPVTS
jgi:hypothetical protein